MKPMRNLRSSSLECPYCNRTFIRKEHRERHIHSHTKTKPFACEVCHKQFGRRDVYQRHLRSQHPAEAPILTLNKKRAQAACDSCHSRKVKCNSVEPPCDRCVREGIDCTFLRTLNSSSTHPEPQIDSPQDSMPEISLQGNFLDPQASPAGPVWHQEASGTLQGTLPLPPVDLAFQDVSFSEDFTSGLLDFDFIQTESYLDLNILDQLPPFPSLDLLPIPSVPERPSGSQSSRIQGAYAHLQAYSSPTDISRPASPRAKADHENWLHRLGKKQKVQYDPTVLNIFLNLFRVHVATTFRCFEGFVVTDATPIELLISMASVGALYCTTPGSIRLAKSLYNHGRVALLSKVHHRRPSPDDDQLAIPQTYMLLELFGYLSGDSRFHEIAEVYHWEMIQIISTCGLWSPSQFERETERKRTIEGICILECYRVTILHAAATFSLALPNSTSPERGIGGPSEEPLLAQLRWIMSSDLTPLPENIPGNENSTIWSLCCLSLLLPWAAVKTTCQRDQPDFEHSRRGEVLESALHRWSTMTNGQTPIPTLMLLHMICLNLHAHVPKIKKLAFRKCDPNSLLATSSTMGTGGVSSAHAFPSQVDRQNALWHAKQIIDLAGRLKQDRTCVKPTDEGPHFSYCVFFAALTLWYVGCHDSDSPRPAASLNMAIDVLYASPVQVAKTFIPTLQSLLD